MPNSVFLSHSSRDNEFCDRLALDLTDYDIGVWYDKWEIKVGDSLREKIGSGIETNDFLAVVLSTASVDSDWVQQELNAALAKELSERKVVVLPLLIEDCDIPIFLNDKKWADFRTDYDAGLQALLDVLGVKKRAIGKEPQAKPPTGGSHRNDELAYPQDHFEAWFVDRLQEANRVRMQRYLWNWRDAALNIEPIRADEEISAKQLEFPKEGIDLLSKLALAGNVLVRYQDEELFGRLATVLYDIYQAINRWGTTAGRTSVDVNIRPAFARCGLMDVVFVLGAASVDQRADALLPHLIARNTPDQGYWERRGWFRYALTMAARGTPNSRDRWYLPLLRAVGFLEENDAISRYFLDAERALDCLCQFDLLQAVYWVLPSRRPDAYSDSYPSCAFYSPRRVMPLMKDLIAREGSASILGAYTDQQLADIVARFTEIARDNAGLVGYAGWADDEWEDDAVSRFLRENRSQGGAAKA